MEASTDAINLIKSSESCAKLRPDGRYEAYPDPARGWAVPTIGWGSTGIDIKKGTIWTKEQCDQRLIAHVLLVSQQVTNALKGAKTTQHQFDALVDFTYNLGIGNLLSSTLLRLHRAGEYDKASREFDRWNKSKGRVLYGLVKRRDKEEELYDED